VRMACTTTRTYEVVSTSSVFDTSNPVLSEALGCERGLVVVDAGVAPSDVAALREYLDVRLPGFVTLVVAVSEETKTVNAVLDICATAQRLCLGRRDVLVAVGGGVCCDLVTVAASLIRRGIPYVTVPTTLLAQVDAGIALKGGVNFGGHKNYLGCFYPPTGVVVDPRFLRTLPCAELESGVAEIVKIALVRDRALVLALLEHGRALVESRFQAPIAVGAELISRSVELMLQELAANPYEEGDLHRLVDFGHTFSPRLEELSAWKIRHGHAVAVDIALSSALAVELGILTDPDLQQILTLMKSLGLPLSSPLLTELAIYEALDAAVRHRAGALNLVVPKSLGEATFVEQPADLPSDAVARALRRLTASPSDATTARDVAGKSVLSNGSVGVGSTWPGRDRSVQDHSVARAPV
jgi:3-dehydroquinate synthetase